MACVKSFPLSRKVISYSARLFTNEYGSRLRFSSRLSLNPLNTSPALEVKYLVKGLPTELDQRQDPDQQDTSVGADTGSSVGIWVSEGDDGERRDPQTRGRGGAKVQ